MSALAFKLLLHLCVWSKVIQANGIQNLRFPTTFNNNQWRLNRRQDFLTKPRFLVWKPAIPVNFNRYGIQSPPIMAPIHQSYMFAIPTKVNYAPYQPVKDIEEKRKPGNLHHIRVINAILPKPFLSTASTHSHPTATFQSYRMNNKQLFPPYFNNFGRQNAENLNQMTAKHLQLQQQQQQQQQQPLHVVYPSSPLALQMPKPTIESINGKHYNTNSHEHEGTPINSPVSPCGRKIRNDTNNSVSSASDALHYYCNNRITNYKNPTQQQLISIEQPTTTSSTTTSTTTTTTTTEMPIITTTQSSRIEFNPFTTVRPIFLPTPNAPLENSFIPLSSTPISRNSITESGANDHFKPQKQKIYKHHRQSVSRYEDVKRQFPYTTTPAYDNMKFHSFFTIEDAVTRAPQMQVFNDPHQAYRHARRQQISHQRSTLSTTKIPDITTTTTESTLKSFFDDLYDDHYSPSYRHVRKRPTIHQRQTATAIPETKTTASKPKFKSFFDELDDEDYIIPEAPQYDDSFFSNSHKSAYHESEFKNKHRFPQHNQITDHTHESDEGDEFNAVAETFVGRPKIKEHQFRLFKSISPTTYASPTVTTHKPKDLFSATHATPSSRPTFHTMLGHQEPYIENDKNNNTVFLKEVSTTTSTPVETPTEKKSFVSTFKPTLSLRSLTTFKYPKPRRLENKLLKNVTSTTTKATPTLKKVSKYQRQYKAKKLKQFKQLYTTTSTTTTTAPTTTTTTTTTSSTTTTATPTTTEGHTTKRELIRLLPAAYATEETTSKRTISSRVVSTTETPKQKHVRHQSSLTTEATKRKKVKVRTSTAAPIKINDSTIRPQSGRRGSKRANVSKTEKETTKDIPKKANSKNRRRLTPTSTTAKPLVTRTASGLVSMSTSSSTPTPTSLRTSSTTTTMKSIMRISNSKSRSRPQNDIRPQSKAINGVSDDRQDLIDRVSIKSIASTVANIPPLPIEIYFKKSHNPKM